MGLLIVHCYLVYFMVSSVFLFLARPFDLVFICLPIDFGQSGALALACFVVIAVCPLNRRWLMMEQTAQSAGMRLSELNSREGDWFLDELCTMSGNVSQMIDLLESCFEV